MTFDERFWFFGWTAPEGGHVMTWAFVLEETEHGSTRLAVRVTLSRSYGAEGYGRDQAEMPTPGCTNRAGELEEGAA